MALFAAGCNSSNKAGTSCGCWSSWRWTKRLKSPATSLSLRLTWVLTHWIQRLKQVASLTCSRMMNRLCTMLAACCSIERNSRRILMRIQLHWNKINHRETSIKRPWVSTFFSPHIFWTVFSDSQKRLIASQLKPRKG